MADAFISDAARLNELNRINANADAAVERSKNALNNIDAEYAAYRASKGLPPVDTKPDGTTISGDIKIPGISQGLASITTGAKGLGATLDLGNLNKVKLDPNKTSNILSFGIKSPAGGPPYENVLEQFASYTPVWTLACLEPGQFNNPARYRGKPAAVRNIVFSSAGRFDSQRTRTAYGTPEYFVDNVVLNTKLAAGPAQGNTNVIGLSFDVYEPYSLGLFIQSLQNAAIYAGYPSYFNNTPFLLKLEFLGFKDNGAIFNSSETLAKYFTIKITKVDFTVNEGGSQYKVEAVPLHHSGYEDGTNILPTDATITGEDCKEMLVSGQRSLCTVLNAIQEEMVDKGQQEYPDLYAVVFPVDHSDPVGVTSEDEFVEQLRATADPNAEVKQGLTDRPGQLSQDYGFGEIGEASMGFGPTSGGNYLFPLEGETADPATGIINRDQMQIDPKQRAFMFKQGEKITEVVQRVILASEYGVQAIKAENLDAEGRAKWFRIDVQIQLLEYDSIRNVRSKKYVYRVVPYKVNGSILKNPSSVTAGTENLKQIIAKRYNYLYTGQNNDILKFDLKFDGMFYTGQLPRPPTQNANIANKDVQNAAPPDVNQAEVNKGAAPEAAVSTTGTASVKPDYKIKTASASGDKTVEQVVADAFQQAFLNSSKDLINVEIDILGDPFYLSDSGINSNYFAEAGPTDQVNADGSMNWEGSQIYAELNFRNPIEPNLGVTGVGGTWNFPNGGAVSPFSGVYMVHEVTNKFSSGSFQQTLKMVRQPNQPQDVEGQATIAKRDQGLYDTSKPEPEKTGPNDDTTTLAGADPSGDGSGGE